MPLSGRYRAVIFDMDGLLLDTEELWLRAERELFRRHGEHFTEEDQRAVVGTGVDFSARYYARRLGMPPERGLSLTEEVNELMHEELRRQVRARPGAVELIARLRAESDARLALASNSPRRLVDAALATAGLSDVFATIVTAEDVARPKPAPDIYVEACRRLGVDPSEAVALEDSPSGVRAAKAAGLDCIAVPLLAETDVSAADQVVDSLEVLLRS
jgi:HAD superfamily hydrolase (TIGR01509 family)